MSLIDKTVAILLILLLLEHSKGEFQSESFLSEIHEKLNLKKYIYIFDDYDENFAASLLSIKNRFNSIRTFFYTSDALNAKFYGHEKNKSFSLEWYNVYCHLINDNYNGSIMNIAIFVQTFKILLQVQKFLLASMF